MQQATQDWTNYAGPVAAAYEHNRQPVSVIEGPTGGGKSQASARRCLRVALMQEPSPRDGWRKARICCVAPTYRILWDTAIQSFTKVFSGLGGKFSGGKGDPADYVLDIKRPDGKGGFDLIHLEVQFRALREESAELFVRGREVTAWWLPEMDTLPSADLLGLTTNRVGRYPEPDDRPMPDPSRQAPFAGVFGDCNTPVIGSWFHKHFYLEHRNSGGFFRQPPAILSDGKTVNPAAENLHNLRKIREDYYQNMISSETMSDYDVRRLLMCQPGWSRFGKPVHEHFDDARMVAKAALPIENDLQLRIGVDAGNTLKPSATFTQRTWSGQVRVLAEISAAHRQMDLAEFAAEIRRIKDTTFREVKSATIIVDPSARAKSTENRQVSYAQILQARTKIAVRLAPSNDPAKRRSAVDALMRRNAGPGEPALIIDPSCTGLIEALSGGYRFKKHGDAYSPQPEKNDHSHEAEAFQYDILDGEGLGPIDGGFIPPHGGAAYASPGVILE